MDFPKLRKLLDSDIKEDLDGRKTICRCCFRKETGMLDVKDYNSYFVDLAGLNVMQVDGLPQTICWECAAHLRKAVRFKRRLLKAHNLLVQYVAQCTPFPLEVDEKELSKYGISHLMETSVVVIDTHNFLSSGEYQYEEHNRGIFAETPWEPPKMEDDIKVENGLTDYEDNITLDEIRSADKNIADEILATLLGADEATGMPEKKKKKSKKIKRRDKKKKKTIKEEDLQEYKPELQTQRMPIRKPPELDPNQIRVIELNPEEQFKQRQEESRLGIGLPFQCKFCYKGFNFESKLNSHMIKHNPARGDFKCELCTMYLPTPYSLTVHSLIHTRRYECVVCLRRMIDRASILDHYRSAHEGVVQQYSCDICNKVFHNNKTLRGHMRNHHSGQRPECDRCGKSFVNKDSLAEHIQIHDGVLNYECSECGRRFRTRTQIIRHQAKHTVTSKEFYCVECDIKFKTQQTLRMHLIRSSKHKDFKNLPFSCSRCDKRFETELNLSRHITIQHEGVRAHICSTCGAALATKGSLKKHMSSIHQNKRPPPRHVCDTCGKAFRGKSVLVNHVRTHTGEKPFECRECGRRFSQRTSMKTHYKLVHLKVKRNFKVKSTDPVIDIKVDEVPKLEPIRPLNDPVRPAVDPWRSQYDPFFRVTAGP